MTSPIYRPELPQSYASRAYLVVKTSDTSKAVAAIAPRAPSRTDLTLAQGYTQYTLSLTTDEFNELDQRLADTGTPYLLSRDQQIASSLPVQPLETSTVLGRWVGSLGSAQNIAIAGPVPTGKRWRILAASVTLSEHPLSAVDTFQLGVVLGTGGVDTAEICAVLYATGAASSAPTTSSISYDYNSSPTMAAGKTANLYLRLLSGSYGTSMSALASVTYIEEDA